MSKDQTTHYLQRTSPKGEPFVGRCILCGDVGLPSIAATYPCPNPAGVSQDDAVMKLVIGDMT